MSSTPPPSPPGPDPAIEAFIARWQGREGGQERANYALFLREFCAALGVRPPDPAGDLENNDYVFERAVRSSARQGPDSWLRIDLYYRDHFVLEAKQARLKGGTKEVAGQGSLFAPEPLQRGRGGDQRSWDVLMQNARTQAEDYVHRLPASHAPPPFVIVLDVGHCLEIYANFRRDGKAYDQFPDRHAFRVYLEDLRKPEILKRLRAIWNDPMSLDPAREAARVTREIARRLAAVSRALEGQGHPADDVAMFLMRCLFTMFAQDVDLIPRHSFTQLLDACAREPQRFQPEVLQLWEAMDIGAYSHALHTHVVKFNGEFFRNKAVLALAREEIGELRAAAAYDWREVDPSIFGALLEQALDKTERRRLGAHYTPRAYVERLVIATVIDPLRARWDAVRLSIDRRREELSRWGPHDRRRDAAHREAREEALKFHRELCRIRVLDPACGTGNFLYVALELMKRLEGEILDVLESLGGQEGAAFLDSENVDPHQFLGLEINPRAAAIAELVLWIGFLQWHFRTRTQKPPPPILKAFRNIRNRDAVLEADERLALDAQGRPLTRKGPDGDMREVKVYAKPRRPVWPEAEYIVGNPPFIGGKDLRARLGDAYAEALWTAHPDMNESADFVMYWWDRAAELLTRKGTVLQRFGFVTTNSISQVFQRRTIERRMQGKAPIALTMAIPDHPWTKAAPEAAAVRIAMTVARAGEGEGLLLEVAKEAALDTDAPVIELRSRKGVIHADLTVGAELATTGGLRSNSGLASRGMSLHGNGFIVTANEAAVLGLGRRPGLERHIREYRNGRDLTAHARGALVIDMFGLGVEEMRTRFPEVYQHLATRVKPVREELAKSSKSKDMLSYASLWWLFGKPRQELRPALADLPRYIATVETAKHRVFQFLDAAILPDNMLVAIASDDAFTLGVLSSRVHLAWSSAQGGTLEDRPRYTKSQCFDPFPFPAADDLQKHRLRQAAEALDAHRKRVLAEHPHLTLTSLYNVLEKLRAGVAPDALDAADRRIFDDGLALILKEHHDAIDALAAAAYGWPADLADEDILSGLVALNAERAREEAAGHVRWLRPDYQIPRFGSAAEKSQLDLGLVEAEAAAPKGPKPAFPADYTEQNAAVMSVLELSERPLDVAALAARFKPGRHAAPAIAAILASFVRMGFASSADGRTFSARRAA